MKLHIANPATGCNKMLDVDDENKLRLFYEKRIGQEIEVDQLGSEYKGYVFKITGGCDKAGFPMKQGVLTQSRVRLLLPRGALGFQKWRGRRGERRRKSVRGCIVSSEIAVLNVSISKKGEGELEGLTTETKPRTHGPKRASRIRKLFNLSKEDDVRKFVIKKKVTLKPKNGEPITLQTNPTIQRLITPERLRRKRVLQKRSEQRKTVSKIVKQKYNALLKRKREEKEEKNKKPKEEVKKEEVKKEVKKDVKKTTKKGQKKVGTVITEPNLKKEEKKPVEKKEEKKDEKKPVEKKPVEKKPAEKKPTEKKEEKKPVEKKPTEKKPVEKKQTEKKK